LTILKGFHAYPGTVLSVFLLCSGLGVCSEAKEARCPCRGEEEIVGTVLESVEKDVSKLLTRVVNVTLRVEVDDVACSQNGLVAGDRIRVLYTEHSYGGREAAPVPGACQRLRLCLERFGKGDSYRPARPGRHFERLPE
jgi:hypothetical protein